ncbi:MAG: glycosyltransferase [Kiritimatiellae bacterium]|nr:glycosyltransferase [Kiritimatiellia bacterium]
MKKVQILHLVDFLGPGGAQELIRLSIKMSSPEFTHKVVVLTGVKPYYEASIRDAGAEVQYLSQFWKAGLVISMPLLAARFRGILKQSQPDILHLHMPGSMIVGSVGSLGLRLKRMLTIYAWRSAFAPWVFPCIRMLNPLFDGVCAVDRTEIPWVSDAKFVKYYSGVEQPIDFSAGVQGLRKEFMLDGREPLLFSIGRLHPDKGHADAMRAFTEVRKIFPRAVLFVIGEGGEKETRRLHDLSETLGGDGIVFTGHRSDLNSFLGLGGFFLRTSKNECGNMSTILVAFAGVVAIGYSMENVLRTEIEMIRDGQTGKIVPLGDFSQMAQEVVDLWRNRAEYDRLSAGSVRHARGQWDIQHTLVDPVESAYHKILLS